MNEEDMFRVNDLDGDGVIMDVTAGENVEQSIKVVEKDVCTTDPVTIADKGKEIMVEPEKPLKKKDQIAFDEEVTRKLDAHMKAKMEEEERITREKDEANIAIVEERSKKTQAKVTEGSSKRVRDELEQESAKRQKLDEQVEAKVDNDQREAEMKMYMKIIPDDEIAIDAIPLATKPLIIVDWKIIKEGKIGSYHLIRDDGSSKRYSSMI
nr:hypothetical protein [Tanacetum cinerariifolium]